MKNLDNALHRLYYTPKSAVAFSGVHRLHQAIRQHKKFLNVKIEQVKDWLDSQKTYTLHKPIHRKFKRRQTIVAGIDYQWQADLADLSHLMKYNDQYRYLLCVIDVFSKYAWVVPIKNKMGKTLIQAFQSILKQGRSCISFQSDKGSEFKNKDFQHFLKKKNIHFFTTENPETKASVVERFQRTLKSRMWKYFTYKKTLRYVDVLQDLVLGYNHAYHRSIRRSPISVKHENEVEVSQALYGNKTKPSKAKLKVGDLVRINKTKRTFDKGYLPNWTTELFKITAIVKSSPATYKVKDLADENIQGTFYAKELQRIKDDDLYDIDSIVDRRSRREGSKLVKEVKVHWSGYPSSFDSWILESDLIKYK